MLSFVNFPSFLPLFPMSVYIHLLSQKNKGLSVNKPLTLTLPHTRKADNPRSVFNHAIRAITAVSILYICLGRFQPGDGPRQHVLTLFGSYHIPLTPISDTPFNLNIMRMEGVKIIMRVYTPNLLRVNNFLAITLSAGLSLAAHVRKEYLNLNPCCKAAAFPYIIN